MLLTGTDKPDLPIVTAILATPVFAQFAAAVAGVGGGPRAGVPPPILCATAGCGFATDKPGGLCSKCAAAAAKPRGGYRNKTRSKKRAQRLRDKKKN